MNIPQPPPPPPPLSRLGTVQVTTVQINNNLYNRRVSREIWIKQALVSFSKTPNSTIRAILMLFDTHSCQIALETILYTHNEIFLLFQAKQ